MSEEKQSLIPIPKNGVLLMAEEYIQKAERGERLSKEQRRHAVEYIDQHFPNISKVQIAKLFGVDEGTIRYDLRQLKQAKTDSIREDTDVKLIIADLLQARERAVTNVYKSMQQMEREGKVGTKTYLEAQKLLVDLHMKVTVSLQDMGWLPKNIGTVTVNKHVYKSIVQERTGAVETRPLNLFDDIREGESLQDAIKRHMRAEAEYIEDAEYEEVPLKELPQLPAAEQTTDNNATSQIKNDATQSSGQNSDQASGGSDRTDPSPAGTTQ